MKSLIFRFIRFWQNDDGPTAMESAMFFAVVVILCAISAKMAQSNLAGELSIIRP